MNFAVAHHDPPVCAVAKFAAAGKPLPKKDLGRLAMSYGNVYVAKVAFGANDRQTIQAIMEAEAYDGPSLIIAYSHCIAHGYDLKYGLEQQQAAVDSGHWVLYRYNPDLANPPSPEANGHETKPGQNPFQLDSKAPSIPLEKYIYREGRYRMLQQSNPEAADRLLELAKSDVARRWEYYKKLATNQDIAERVATGN